MKKGFTLAEVLITLGIIGVVAAITVPAIISQLPCENKIKFLKAHAALTSTISDLVIDPTLYYQPAPPAASCKVLACLGAPLDGNDRGINGETEAYEKLARLVASRMTKSSDIASEGNDFIFTTTDGTTWRFTQNNNGGNVADVVIDVNGGDQQTPDSPNCPYHDKNNYFNANSNAIIDQFEFTIDEDGGITPRTAFEAQVLANPSNLKRDEYKTLSHTQNLQ